MAKTTMTDARRNEIAYLLLKHQAREQGINLEASVQQTRDGVREKATEIGLSSEEAFEFAKTMYRDLFRDAFGEPLDETSPPAPAS